MSKNNLTILGVDPGINKTGWGIISGEGNILNVVACGVIKPKQTLENASKLLFIHKNLSEIVEKYKPLEVAIEIIFVNKNAKSSLKLESARSAAILSLAIYGYQKIFEYYPTEIKKAITGSGSADKNQMIKMISNLLKIKNDLKSDEADALCVALTHQLTCKNRVC